MQTIVLYLRYIVLILLFSSAYNTFLIYCFVIWCLHTNKRRPCSSTLSGHPSSRKSDSFAKVGYYESLSLYTLQLVKGYHLLPPGDPAGEWHRTLTFPFIGSSQASEGEPFQIPPHAAAPDTPLAAHLQGDNLVWMNLHKKSCCSTWVRRKRNMEFAKDPRKKVFIREEWPFADKGI